MKLVIKRGVAMAGPWGQPLRSETDKLYIAVQHRLEDGTELGHGWVIDLERIRTLLPGEEIIG